jgi:hypothetical protein
VAKGHQGAECLKFTQALLQPYAFKGKWQFYLAAGNKSQGIGVNILAIQDLTAIASQWVFVVTSFGQNSMPEGFLACTRRYEKLPESLLQSGSAP